MSHITIHISTDNDAFAEDGSVEVARILTELSSRVIRWDGNVANWSDDVIPVRDSNGNRVGEMRVSE